MTSSSQICHASIREGIINNITFSLVKRGVTQVLYEFEVIF